MSHPVRSVLLLGGLVVLLALPASGQPPLEELARWDAWRVEILAKVRPAVVQVHSVEALVPESFPWQAFGIGPDQLPQAQRNVGSGVLYSDRLVFTTADVVGNREIEVQTSSGERIKGRLMGEDPVANVAVIELERSVPIRPVAVQPRPELSEGSWVAMLGYSFGGIPIVAEGLAVGPPRRGVVMGDGRHYFLMSFPVLPGAAGAPIIDSSGRMIGLAAGMVDGGQLSVERGESVGANLLSGVGMGLAVPIRRAVRSAQAIMAGEPLCYGWLGVTARAIRGQLEVISVEERSPASQAGLRRGDVIRSLDGEPVRGVEDMVSHLQDVPIGSRIGLEIHRAEETLQMAVAVGERPPRPTRGEPVLSRILRQASESREGRGMDTDEIRQRLHQLEQELQAVRDALEQLEASPE